MQGANVEVEKLLVLGNFVPDLLTTQLVEPAIDNDLLAQIIAEDEIEVGTWQITMRQLLRDSFADQLRAACEPNRPDSSDYLMLGPMLKTQYDYLEGFAKDIAAGFMTYALGRRVAGILGAQANQDLGCENNGQLELGVELLVGGRDRIEKVQHGRQIKRLGAVVVEGVDLLAVVDGVDALTATAGPARDAGLDVAFGGPVVERIGPTTPTPPSSSDSQSR